MHGGPTGQFFRNFNPYAQFLADRGHVLLLPNVRGSTGYGVEFRDMNIKDWGGGDLEKAKLLIIHGVNDPRCPIEQARIARDRLLALGKVEDEDFEYIEFSDEGHSTQDIEQRVRSYRLLADFMERRL